MSSELTQQDDETVQRLGVEGGLLPPIPEHTPLDAVSQLFSEASVQDHRPHDERPHDDPLHSEFGPRLADELGLRRSSRSTRRIHQYREDIFELEEEQPLSDEDEEEEQILGQVDDEEEADRERVYQEIKEFMEDRGMTLEEFTRRHAMEGQEPVPGITLLRGAAEKEVDFAVLAGTLRDTSLRPWIVPAL